MKLCRYNNDQLGLIDGTEILNVTAALDGLPAIRWTQIMADPLIANLAEIRAKVDQLAASAERLSADSVTLNAPVAMPTKIIGAPVNYHAHFDEALLDVAMHQDRVVHPIDEIGCFLKANSGLTGHGSKIPLPFDDARIDHEAEIAVIIGKPAHKVLAANAYDYVAGYSLALDMTVRGKQDRSLRKSCDQFAVLGPFMATADEIKNPEDLAFNLTVNGEERQKANTSMLIRSIPELIEMTSAFYTLMPGDIIMTGTPAGVSQVASGDVIEVNCPELGMLSVTIA